jgi:hypothetical protein
MPPALSSAAPVLSTSPNNFGLKSEGDRRSSAAADTANSRQVGCDGGMTMRKSFWAVVAIVACLAGSVAHAQTAGGPASCLNGDKLPTKATFDNGFVQTVLERSGGKLHHEMMAPGGQKASVVSYYGLFTLTSELPTVKIEYTYNQDLTQFMPLKVGERVMVNASTKNSQNKPMPDLAIEMTVVGVESMSIGPCDYPVFKIEVRTQIGGQQATGFRYYHQSSMLTLRTVMSTPATTNPAPILPEYRAVKLE